MFSGQSSGPLDSTRCLAPGFWGPLGGVFGVGGGCTRVSLGRMPRAHPAGGCTPRLPDAAGRLGA